MSLLLLLPAACGTTRGSLRGELEQRDDRHSEVLASNRRAAMGQKPKAPETPTNARGALNQKIHKRLEWGALPLNTAKLDVVGGRWEKITVHHSDEVGTLVFNGTMAQSAQAVRSIQRQHIRGNNWGDIGYHYLIDGSGRVFEGRPLKWQGAHAGDRFKNRRNLGICLLGNFNKHTPSAKAREALRGLLEDLRKAHSIPRAKVYVHSEFKSTDCPGRHLTTWVKSYRGGGSLSHAPR
jgi:hypothetical protein